MGEPKSGNAKTAAHLVLIGSELLAAAVLGIFADQFLGTTPWLTVIGTIGGFVAAAWHAYTVLAAIESRK